jgi:hypothetical protein
MNVKLLKDLNFAGKINECQAVTEAGKEMINNYRGYLFTNPATCGLVNGFVREAQKYGFDTGLTSILESVVSFISENNISWKLASACESIENNPSTYNYIAKTGIETVGKLLEMNESDVKTYIKAGALKSIQYIPEFRAICKEVYKSTITESYAPNYRVNNPVSYVYENEGARYFSVNHKTYKIAEGLVSEAVCDDVTFNRINALLESFQITDGKMIYEWNVGVKKYTVTINENEITFSNNKELNETFNSVVAFDEFCNTLSRTMLMNEKLNFMQITSAISEVYAVNENVVVLDNVKLLESANGSTCAIIEAENNVNLTVFKSINFGTSCQNYDYVAEALKQVTRVSGIDLKVMYENRINEDVKKANPEEYKNIQEELAATKAAQMDIRKKKIAMLAEAHKNDPAIIAVLNKAARDLSLLDK